jgi:protein-tyrosine kinase
VLVDLDLAAPGLARLLGLGDVPPLREFLFGEQPLESHFVRIDKTLALGLNGQAETDPGAILHHPDIAIALEAMQVQLEPEVVLLDMPAALGTDEVISMQPQIDALLLVTDGTRTTPDEIRACEQLFAGRIPILGVILNKAQDRPLARFRKG